MESGIYKIVNKINSKFYIGSSTRLEKRKQDHFCTLKCNTHFNSHLQKSVNKYGLANFEFKILEYCENSKLLEREQYWIDLLNPHYNSIKDVTKGISGYQHSIEEKQRAANRCRQRWENLTDEGKEKEKERLGTLRRGLKVPEEEREKRRLAVIKARGWEKGIEKRRESLKKSNYEKKRKEVLQFDMQNNFMTEFKSIREAGASLQLTPAQYSSIGKVCKGKEGRSQAYGFIWKYKN